MKSSRKTRESVLDLLFITLIVVVVRVMIERVAPLFYENFGLYFNDFIFKTLSNYPVTVAMAAADIACVALIVRRIGYGGRIIFRAFHEIVIILLWAFAGSVVLRAISSESASSTGSFFDKMFLFTLVVNLIFNSVVVLVTDVIFYYRWLNRKALEAEMEQRAKANYRYQMLKVETNPHFLFNSLNVLQYLIEEDPERATDYVRKLSQVYRYFLKIETHTVVTLDEEINFVNQYVDLLKERFGEALQVNITVPQSYMDSSIIPCALQMMIENAVKHNVVNAKSVLRIDISCTSSHICVTNNIAPRLNAASGGGIGLANISKQYRILFNKDIDFSNSGSEYRVRIPIIRSLPAS